MDQDLEASLLDHELPARDAQRTDLWGLRSPVSRWAKATNLNFKLRDGRELKAMRVEFTYYAYSDAEKRWLPSVHSLTIGKAGETQGMFLEHRVHGLQRPVSRLVFIESPSRRETKAK